MKVYNQDKTQILESYDLSKGYLKQDSLLIETPEIQEIKEVFHYEIIKTYPNGGKDLKKIIDRKGVPYSPKATKMEPIQVFVLYTEEELDRRYKNNLRAKRAVLLSGFDKWEKAVLRGREVDSAEIMAWYKNLLDLVETAFENIPERIEYYL